MPRVAIIGGGLAGLAAAAALAEFGFDIEIFESRPFLGGRATSWPVTTGEEDSELIDNCQHVLLRCCVNLLDFYRRLGVEDKIRFFSEYYFLEPGGRLSTLRRGLLPAPAHFAESFTGLHFLNLADKISISRAMLAISHERLRRTDLDSITMLDWLREKRQTRRAIDRFWQQVLVSAVNEDLDRMAAIHGFQVFWLGMLARKDSYQMGVPDVALRDLYSEAAWLRMPNVAIRHRCPVTRVEIAGERIMHLMAGSQTIHADFYILALPFERVAAVAPGLQLDVTGFEHSPITGIHLWFDRAITELPHAALLDRTIQWMFNKSAGRYIQVVVSASRSLVDMPRAKVIELALRELTEFFPAVRAATLERSQVIKEVRATFSAVPGLETKRPTAITGLTNLFLAGDWTRSGWPATMEGAVRSGYLAAEEVACATGNPKRIVLSDIG